MRQSIAILSALAGATFAADTVQFYFPGGADSDPVATIKTANPSTTVMHLACPSGADSSDCGWGVGFDYTIISKTHYQAAIQESTVSLGFGCDLDTAKTQMVCAVTMTGGNDADANPGGPRTATLRGNEISFNTATVVEGASLLSGSAGAASATPASSGASAAPKSTGASAAITGMKTSASAQASGSAASGASVSGSANATTTGSPAQATGAAARFGIEGSALLMFAGAVAVGAF